MALVAVMRTVIPLNVRSALITVRITVRLKASVAIVTVVIATGVTTQVRL